MPQVWRLTRYCNYTSIETCPYPPEQHKKPGLREYTHSHQGDEHGWGSILCRNLGSTTGTLLQTQTPSPEQKPLMWQDGEALLLQFYDCCSSPEKASALIQLTSQSAVFEDRCMGDGCVTCSCGCTDEASIQLWGNVPEVLELWLRPQS